MIVADVFKVLDCYSILPRKPDPQLEQRVVSAALCLLDAGGLPAITLRAVARQARTTTPTIYEPFANRDRLLQSVSRKVALELVSAVGRVQTITRFVSGLVEFCVQHPQRFELIGDAVCFHPVAGQPMPVSQLLKATHQGVRGARDKVRATGHGNRLTGPGHGMRNDCSRKRYTCSQRALPYVPSFAATPTEGVFGFTCRA